MEHIDWQPIRRRRALGIGLSALAPALGLGASTSAAQPAWPAHPIRIVVGFAPGATPDLIARAIAQRISSPLGQTVVVENKPGANGSIAAESVARSAPDGYTVWLADTGQWAINPALRSRLKYDPERDFTPVSKVIDSAFSVVVRADSPARSLGELVALSKSRQQGLVYGSSGEGTIHHLGAEQLRQATDARFLHIPFKSVSAETVPALLRGDIDFMLSSTVPLLGPLSDRKVRLLARGSPQRSPLLPSVPTFAEAGVPGVTVTVSNGLLLPSKTPPAIVERLQQAVSQALREPALRQQLAALDLDLVGSTAQAFAAEMHADIEHYRRLVKALNLKVG